MDPSEFTGPRKRRNTSRELEGGWPYVVAGTIFIFLLFVIDSVLRSMGYLIIPLFLTGVLSTTYGAGFVIRALLAEDQPRRRPYDPYVSVAAKNPRSGKYDSRTKRPHET